VPEVVAEALEALEGSGEEDRKREKRREKRKKGIADRALVNWRKCSASNQRCLRGPQAPAGRVIFIIFFAFFSFLFSGFLSSLFPFSLFSPYQNIRSNPQ
jgi:hypothetical protein